MTSLWAAEDPGSLSEGCRDVGSYWAIALNKVIPFYLTHHKNYCSLQRSPHLNWIFQFSGVGSVQTFLWSKVSQRFSLGDISLRSDIYLGGSQDFLVVRGERPHSGQKTRFDPWFGKTLEKMVTHTPVSLSGKSAWTEEPDRLRPTEWKRAAHNLATKQQFYIMPWWWWHGHVNCPNSIAICFQWVTCKIILLSKLILK